MGNGYRQDKMCQSSDLQAKHLHRDELAGLPVLEHNFTIAARVLVTSPVQYIIARHYEQYNNNSLMNS